jgi:beta-lactamase regulating signal transducer with metallopeptidase domain
MIHIVPDTILRAVCWTLLHSLWQGLIVAVLAGIIMVLTKRSSSSLRYNLLCGLLFLFLWAGGYTFYRQLPVVTSPTASPVVSVLTSPSHVGATAPAAAPAAGAIVHTGIDSLIQYFNSHAALIVLIWFIVFLGRFIQLLSGLVYAQRIRHYRTSAAPAQWHERLQTLLKKVHITRPVLLLESALIKIPVVLGFLKPVILVPVGMLTRLDPGQVESILLHELAHIRRQDYLLNLVQNLVDTLFFFNPAMIWISTLIRTERENCCDDIAIRETRSRRRLIEALVSFHEYEQAAGGYALSFAAKENQVVRRVKRIVHQKNHSLNAGERVLLTTGLLILCAAFVTINGSRSSEPVKPIKTTVTATKTPKPATVKQSMAITKPVHIQHPSNPLPKPVAESPAQDTTPKPQKPIDLFQNVSVDKLIEARDHGVTAEFVSALQQMGYKNLTLDKAIELRDHGVDAEFIEHIRAIGFTHFSLDEAIVLKDHGVSADYIGGMKKRFGRLFEINDYIKLRDAGISPTTFGQ